MSNIYNTPKDFNPGDPEYLRVEAVGKDKHPEEPPTPINLPLKAEILLSSNIVNGLINQINFFLEHQESHETPTDIQTILKRFKNLLELLRVENKSEDYHFAQNLSDLWHAIKMHTANLLPLKKRPPYVESLDLLVQKINLFPKQSDHSLGYYLSQYAGEKWLLFPFIDILNSLHEEAILKKSNDTLYDWSLAIEAILSTGFINPSISENPPSSE